MDFLVESFWAKVGFVLTEFEIVKFFFAGSVSVVFVLTGRIGQVSVLLDLTSGSGSEIVNLAEVLMLFLNFRNVSLPLILAVNYRK